MLYPCSPPGRPQPSMMSSMERGSSCGTLASAALIIWTVMSSGRRSLSEPLKARPMGERAVATMTASGMAPPLSAVLELYSNTFLPDIGTPTQREGPGADRSAPGPPAARRTPEGAAACGRTGPIPWSPAFLGESQPYIPGVGAVPSWTACIAPFSSRQSRQPCWLPVYQTGGAPASATRLPDARSYSHSAAVE